MHRVLYTRLTVEVLLLDSSAVLYFPDQLTFSIFIGHHRVLDEL